MTIFLLIFHFSLISAEKWIKLPEIKPQAKLREIPQVVFKLAPLSGPVTTSDVINSVFSYTTKSPITTTTKSRFFHSTVTSKVVNFPSNVSELLDEEEFLQEIPVVQILKPNFAKIQRVKFFNQTMSMNVVPIVDDGGVVKDDDENNANPPQPPLGESNEEEEDDGVTITDDFNDSLEDYYDDNEDYANEAHPMYKSKSTTTTTSTPPPKREHKIAVNSNLKKSERRVISIRPKKPDLNFSTFLKFIKTIQESLAIRTAKTINDKVKMLMEFRDSLMTTINQQIRRLWKIQPKVIKQRKFRVKRTLGEGLMDKGGAMDFPSAEGALLSICFLIFAVFLIKLVLQVIHTIKMKKAMWAASMMTNEATQNVVIKRHKRRSDEDEEYREIARKMVAIHGGLM